MGNLDPQAVVVVATIRALKMHGGVAKDALASENVAALRAGSTTLSRDQRQAQKAFPFSGTPPAQTGRGLALALCKRCGAA